MDIEGQDYRACQTTARCTSVNTLLPDVMPGRSATGPEQARVVSRISNVIRLIAGAIMKQEVILVLDCGATKSGPSRLIGREKLLPAPQRLSQRYRDGKQHLAPVVFRRHFQRFADCCRQINSELTECHIRVSPSPPLVWMALW